MSVRIMFYNPDAADKKTLTDRLIQLRSQLTHVELVFPQMEDVSFSFSLMDRVCGARFKKIQYSHPERWIEIFLPTSKNADKQMFAKAAEMAGFSDTNLAEELISQLAAGQILYTKDHWGYDLPGLLSFARQTDSPTLDHPLLKTVRPVLWSWTKLIKPHPKKAWCSEGVALALRAADPMFQAVPDQMTPDDLCNYLLYYKRLSHQRKDDYAGKQRQV